MFNSTHTLVGLAIARAGADRWSRHAAWTAAIASNLPDIDIVAAVYDQPAYIEYHRGITHAIIGVPLLSLVVAAGMYKFSGNFWRTFAIALLAMSTHPFLDYMNTYGLRPFLPLLAAFAAGRFASKRRQQFALAGLVIVAMYTAARIELRNLSRSYVASFEKAAVSPHPFNPFRWIGLIDNPGEVSVVVVDAFRGLIGEPDRLAKAPTSDIVIRASQTRSAKVFHDFARFPVTTVTPRESGYSVIFLDVRYLRGSEAFAAKILLDGSLQVVDESLSFSQPLD
jgi:inner membrane protein